MVVDGGRPCHRTMWASIFDVAWWFARLCFDELTPYMCDCIGIVLLAGTNNTLRSIATNGAAM